VSSKKRKTNSTKKEEKDQKIIKNRKEKKHKKSGLEFAEFFNLTFCSQVCFPLCRKEFRCGGGETTSSSS